MKKRFVDNKELNREDGWQHQYDDAESLDAIAWCLIIATALFFIFKAM